MGAQEAVGLRDVHPGQQVRVRGRVRAPVGRGPVNPLVDCLDPIDRFLRVADPAERRDGQEVTGPLQPPPRVTAEPRVPGHRRHSQWVQRLQQQGPDPADEHRGVPVHAADRPVLSEHALAFGADQLAAFRTLRPGHPLEDRRADPGPNPIRGPLSCHAPHYQLSL